MHTGTYSLNERLDADNDRVVCGDQKTEARLLGEVLPESTQ